MTFPLYLAMTYAEFMSAAVLPKHPAWMACHFSPYGTGLTNLPNFLPEGSMLILNDRIPIQGHAPQRILEQLKECLKKQKASSILLDFQRPGEEETRRLTELLVQELPFPIGVAEPYAQNLNCAVFVPPVPIDTPLEAWLSPYSGREIWLDTALEPAVISVSKKGASWHSAADIPQTGLQSADLHCHYSIRLTGETADFTLWRNREDLAVLLDEAMKLGVTKAVGLFQELQSKNLPA